MSRQTLSTEDKLAIKRERVPAHEARDRLSLRGLDHDKFAYRWAIQENLDKINVLFEAGYVPVLSGGAPAGDASVDSVKGNSAYITKSAGKGSTYILMCIPRELYELDQQAKEDKYNAELEADIFRDLKAKSDPRLGNLGRIESFGSQLTRGNKPAR